MTSPLRDKANRTRRGARRRLCAATVALALLCGLVVRPAVAQQATRPAPAQSTATGGLPDDAQAELAFIESLYREGEAYRAESEALRFLHDRPQHPQRAAVELARAKLYYREGRYETANLMLYALLDRAPPAPVALDARRLLTFSQLRSGQPQRAAETADALAGPGGRAPALEALREVADPAVPPPGAVDADAAETWSTWLPGSGYALLDEPRKAATGIALNVALLGLVALSVQNENAPAALLFLALEGMLWKGGRSGVRQEAEAINRRLRQRRLDGWLERHGEPELLGVGIALRFGG